MLVPNFVDNDHGANYDEGDCDDDPTRNVASSRSLLHLGVAVEAHGANHEPPVVACRVQGQARVLVADLHPTPLLESQVLLITDCL